MRQKKFETETLSYADMKRILKKHGIEVFADGVGNVSFDYNEKRFNNKISLGGYIDMPGKEYTIATKWFVNDKRNSDYAKWKILPDESSYIKYPNAESRSNKESCEWEYSFEFIQKLIEAKDRLEKYLAQKNVQARRAKYWDAYLQTCYSCEIHFCGHDSKMRWKGFACIHGTEIKCLTGTSFTEVLSKIVEANKRFG